MIDSRPTLLLFGDFSGSFGVGVAGGRASASPRGNGFLSAGGSLTLDHQPPFSWIMDE